VGLNLTRPTAGKTNHPELAGSLAVTSSCCVSHNLNLQRNNDLAFSDEVNIV
jgi:hypothetical protein